MEAQIKKDTVKCSSTCFKDAVSCGKSYRGNYVLWPDLGDFRIWARTPTAHVSEKRRECPNPGGGSLPWCCLHHPRTPGSSMCSLPMPSSVPPPWKAWLTWSRWWGSGLTWRCQEAPASILPIIDPTRRQVWPVTKFLVPWLSIIKRFGVYYTDIFKSVLDPQICFI